MKAPPAFQAYARDWLGDPEVSSCSPATRGIWWDAICAMHEAGRTGRLTGTLDELARICRCVPAEMEVAIAELKRSQAADVTFRNGRVTLINRRMSREHKSRDSSRIRQARRRRSLSDNADVTSLLQSSTSTSTSKKEKHTARARGFDTFWKAYPRKVGKGAAEKAWAKANGKPPLPEILAALERVKTTDQWRQTRYIPYPSTWINEKRWGDDPPSGGDWESMTEEERLQAAWAKGVPG